MGILFREPGIIVRYSTLKGFLFIAVTGGLLYHLIAQHILQSRAAEESLKSLNDELETRVARRTAELEASGKELQRQNEELQQAYRGIEKETAKRLQTMEELRIKDRLMIHQGQMAAMGEMLRNVAHQWRQPLNLLGLKVQEMGLLYKDGVLSEETVKSAIGEMMTIIASLSCTIDDVRSLADPDAEKSWFSVMRS
ncbi:sensor histidine kinase [Geomesophilobacter sediminis]|uniref:Signal transduction histidine kinase dimerisation/phosphoacceptor domain-containing protein n=1 Tax=Geomesophilobacter sediminis TaxID=2798584 RepID=A0A8J7JIB4_9BACT|nr:hypothetical protein [Geomesophilobacter sediminis]MBJ6724185.1 hypothetical protein [Geomesophilobacter sediminis]